MIQPGRPGPAAITEPASARKPEQEFTQPGSGIPAGRITDLKGYQYPSFPLRVTVSMVGRGLSRSTSGNGYNSYAIQLFSVDSLGRGGRGWVIVDGQRVPVLLIWWRWVVLRSYTSGRGGLGSFLDCREKKNLSTRAGTLEGGVVKKMIMRGGGGILRNCFRGTVRVRVTTEPKKEGWTRGMGVVLGGSRNGMKGWGRAFPARRFPKDVLLPHPLQDKGDDPSLAPSCRGKCTRYLEAYPFAPHPRQELSETWARRWLMFPAIETR
eukprot:760381-Hanusia_phi.AAC.6